MSEDSAHILVEIYPLNAQHFKAEKFPTLAGEEGSPETGPILLTRPAKFQLRERRSTAAALRHEGEEWCPSLSTLLNASSVQRIRVKKSFFFNRAIPSL